ncbi:hypothetical protein Dimus_037243, partial [Dionaea muscipula]
PQPSPFSFSQLSNTHSLPLLWRPLPFPHLPSLFFQARRLAARCRQQRKGATASGRLRALIRIIVRRGRSRAVVSKAGSGDFMERDRQEPPNLNGNKLIEVSKLDFTGIPTFQSI